MLNAEVQATGLAVPARGDSANRATGRVTRTEKNERPFRELLESRALLLYRNHDEWYALHPAVKEIEPPKPASPSAPPAED